MAVIVGIDPGLSACGVSVFKAGVLERAGLVRGLDASYPLAARWCALVQNVRIWLDALGDREIELVVEMPKIYPAASQKGDQNDLLNLAGVSAALLTGIDAWPKRHVYPRDWKGTLDADDFIAEHIMPRTTPTERQRIEFPSAASLAHNVWDAVGIGLFACGRLERRRVFPK